jgi:hypothetical protein
MAASLGVTVEELWPVLVERMAFVGELEMWGGLSLIALYVLTLIMTTIVLLRKDDYDRDWDWLGCVAAPGGIVFIMGLCLFFDGLVTSRYPEIAAIQKILGG